MSILIKNAYVLTLDDENKIYEKGEIFIEGDRIKQVGNNLDISECHACEVIDAENMLVMPGLVNSHTHSYASYLKGSCDNLAGDIFMLYTHTGSIKRTPREVYVSTLTNLIEQLKYGNTTVVDHFSQKPQEMEYLDATVQACLDSGVRSMVAPMFTDKRYYETIPAKTETWPQWLMEELNKQSPPSLKDYYDFCLEAIDKWNGKEGMVKITIGTDAANRCSEELLKLTADLMEKTGVGIHTHALESKTQFIQSMDKYGKTIIDYMDEFGLLGNKSALAHLVWLTDGDIQKCADKGVKMIHSPNALIVGPGFTPLRKYMEAGISVGIGSEGSNLGNLSIFDAMRMVALMQSIYEPNYDRWVSAKETIKMATVGGARIYGGENDFGTLEEGKKADIIFLDMNTPNLKPLGNPINQLVYNENGCSVRHAIVNGKKVLENGKVTLVNEDELLEEANEISKKFRMDNNKLEFIEKQVPYFRKMYFDAMSRDVGLNRFVAPHSEYIRNIPKE